MEKTVLKEKILEGLKGQSKLQMAVVAVMVVCMLLVWPGGMVRKEETVRSGDYDHASTEALGIGQESTQFFRADQSRLISLGFVLNFDENQVRSGTLMFVLKDHKGNVVYESTIPYADINAYTYYTIELNTKLKRHGMYQYQIVNQDIEQNQPQVIYNTTEAMCIAENQGFYFNGAEMAGESLSIYTWNSLLNLPNRLSWWGCICVVGFFFYELAGKVKGHR